jgi:hypothetical protein
MRLDDAARFWQRVRVLDPDDCWEWQGGTDGQGYGTFWFEGRSIKAHRAAYYYGRGYRGWVPAGGLKVCHHCDNPPCCNPAHLFLGTQADNLADMRKKGRQRGPRGDRSATAKLTPAQVADIRATYARRGRPGRKQADDPSPSLAEYARLYGVTKGTIYRIVAGESWT